ncbi:type I-E CRISPR-associated endoribonuclease Cas2 [Streptomyces lincolnensis]
MITTSATAVPDHLRGALTRWLIEVTPELYVGTVSAVLTSQVRKSALRASGGDPGRRGAVHVLSA